MLRPRLRSSKRRKKSQKEDYAARPHHWVCCSSPLFPPKKELGIREKALFCEQVQDAPFYVFGLRCHKYWRARNNMAGRNPFFCIEKRRGMHVLLYSTTYQVNLFFFFCPPWVHLANLEGRPRKWKGGEEERRSILAFQVKHFPPPPPPPTVPVCASLPCAPPPRRNAPGPGARTTPGWARERRGQGGCPSFRLMIMMMSGWEEEDASVVDPGQRELYGSLYLFGEAWATLRGRCRQATRRRRRQS